MITNDDIQKIRDSTTINKFFKKINPNYLSCLLSIDPKRLSKLAICIFSIIEKGIFYRKDVKNDIWSKKPISSYDILSFSSQKFSSEKTSSYYNKGIRQLVNGRIIHEYRYLYSSKDGICIRFFSMEPEVYQWRFWDSSTPILPITALRIISSSEEICQKIHKELRANYKHISIEKIEKNFANYIFKHYICQMSPEIKATILPFKVLKNKMKISKYLNDYLINELSNYNSFHGLSDNIKIKISQKNPELIAHLLGEKPMNNLTQKISLDMKKTPSGEENEDLFFVEDDVTCRQENAFRSNAEIAVKQLVNNDLQKNDVLHTDNLILKDPILINNSLNKDNKEYNHDMQKSTLQNEVGNGICKTEILNSSLVENKEKGKEMETMCISDIVPENSSLVKQEKPKKVKIKKQKKAKIEKVKKLKKHIDGFPYNDLTGNIASSQKDLIHFFENTLRKHHKGIVFPKYNKSKNRDSSYVKNIRDASYTIDELIKRDCCNEKIIQEWVEWYAQVYLRRVKIEDPKYATIEYFKRTWGDFDKVRRHDTQTTATPLKQNVGLVDENSIQFRISNIFKNDFCDENIIRSLRFFGLIITANYLNDKIPDVATKIENIMFAISQDKTKKTFIVSIFNSTCRFLCQIEEDLLLKNWLEKYNNVWLYNGCNFEYYKRNNILIGSEGKLAEDFFRELKK